MDPDTIDFRNEIAGVSETAIRWFFQRSNEADREQFFKKGGLGPQGKSAVYVYQGDNDAVLYVGQTSRSIKARQHDQTYPEKDKPWWPKWKTVRYVRIENETDRLTLELLLVLGLQPSYNERPGSRNAAEMFA